MRKRPVVAALIIGVALAAAPVAFQMFTRAPEGAVMIDEFRPFMTHQKVDTFRGYLSEIDAADTEADNVVRPVLEIGDTLEGKTFADAYPSVANLQRTWPDIRSDMTDLVDRMAANIDSYRAVDSLPSFKLFPWFFMVPGLMIAGLSVAAMAADKQGRSTKRLLASLVVMGLAVSIAPVAFQMFTRAPKGGEMITDFKPMMTTERVRHVQGYFITLGAAEGQLRNAAMPLYASIDQPPSITTPAIERFSAEWPTIVSDFSPMISAMSDNIDNFKAVDAMPAFALFPWFFVTPGLMVALLAWLAAADDGGSGKRPAGPVAPLDAFDPAAPCERLSTKERVMS